MTAQLRCMSAWSSSGALPRAPMISAATVFSSPPPTASSDFTSSSSTSSSYETSSISKRSLQLPLLPASPEAASHDMRAPPPTPNATPLLSHDALPQPRDTASAPGRLKKRRRSQRLSGSARSSSARRRHHAQAKAQAETQARMHAQVQALAEAKGLPSPETKEREQLEDLIKEMSRARRRLRGKARIKGRRKPQSRSKSREPAIDVPPDVSPFTPRGASTVGTVRPRRESTPKPSRTERLKSAPSTMERSAVEEAAAKTMEALQAAPLSPPPPAWRPSHRRPCSAITLLHDIGSPPPRPISRPLSSPCPVSHVFYETGEFSAITDTTSSFSSPSPMLLTSSSTLRYSLPPSSGLLLKLEESPPAHVDSLKSPSAVGTSLTVTSPAASMPDAVSDSTSKLPFRPMSLPARIRSMSEPLSTPSLSPRPLTMSSLSSPSSSPFPSPRAVPPSSPVTISPAPRTPSSCGWLISPLPPGTPDKAPSASTHRPTPALDQLLEIPPDDDDTPESALAAAQKAAEKAAREEIASIRSQYLPKVIVEAEENAAKWKMPRPPRWPSDALLLRGGILPKRLSPWRRALADKIGRRSALIGKTSITSAPTPPYVRSVGAATAASAARATALARASNKPFKEPSLQVLYKRAQGGSFISELADTEFSRWGEFPAIDITSSIDSQISRLTELAINAFSAMVETTSLKTVVLDKFAAASSSSVVPRTGVTQPATAPATSLATSPVTAPGTVSATATVHSLPTSSSLFTRSSADASSFAATLRPGNRDEDSESNPVYVLDPRRDPSPVRACGRRRWRTLLARARLVRREVEEQRRRRDGRDAYVAWARRKQCEPRPIATTLFARKNFFDAPGPNCNPMPWMT